MGNSKNNGRNRKLSKSDYMRAARKQRQQENIFFDQLEAQQTQQPYRKYKKQSNAKQGNANQNNAQQWNTQQWNAQQGDDADEWQ